MHRLFSSGSRHRCIFIHPRPSQARTFLPRGSTARGSSSTALAVVLLSVRHVLVSAAAAVVPWSLTVVPHGLAVVPLVRGGSTASRGLVRWITVGFCSRL